MGQNLKEVYFDQYCKTCRHLKESDTEDPCNECLSYPENESSHKPVNWEDNSK